MHKLTYMFIAIICLISMLVLNAMGILAYENSLLTAETQKNSMMNLTIKHDTLLNNLRVNSKFYINTNDEVYKTNFFVHRDEYLENDNISLNYHTLIINPFFEDIDSIFTDTSLDLSTQAKYLDFNKAELKHLEDYLNTYNKIIDELTESINKKDMGIITSLYFDELYENQSIHLTALCKSYLERINKDEKNILENKRLLEGSLVLLSLILIVLSACTYHAIIKENRYNSYSRKLYNTVVENINAGLCILDKDYNFEYMNPMYKQILCVTTENIEGKSLTDTFDYNVSGQIKSIMNKNNEIGEIDLLLNNHKKHISYYCFHIKDEGGNCKYIHLINDTTDTQLLHSQLKKQLKEIEYYSHAKDIFIANISHEIKTPINAILGMVHFLKNTTLSHNQKDLVSKIENSSDILLTIINDVLDITKIRNNSLSLYPSDFVLMDVIKNVEDMFINQIVDKGLLWESNYDFNKNLCIHLDKIRLLQILVNLITNAIKFTNSGYIKLSVEILYDGYEIVQLQFCVEDSGIGIAEKDISKLFHEFEQLDNDLTKQHKGTGLGLFICKSILDSMGGRIWVKSEKGEGSKFYFSIPAAKAYNSTLLMPNIEDIGSIPFNGNNGRALVVEDTEINAELTVKFLNDVNVNCDIATDGLEAIEMCKNKSQDYYNIILMDIHMPNMDGYTAAKKLKNELGIKAPIIAITASNIDEQIRKEHIDTIDDFILKPFKTSAFYKTISAYFTHCDKDIPQKSNLDSDNKDVMVIPGLKEGVNNQRNPFEGRDEAIKNLGGLDSIYYKHLGKFKANYVNSPLEIKAFVDEGKYDEARRLAHSIKGLGGTLGMLDVQNTAATLEQAILKGESHDISAELEAFQNALKEAIDAI